MSTEAGLKKVRVSAMNAVHDLAVLVARDEGLFEKEGLDLEVLATPGTGNWVRTGRPLKKTYLTGLWKAYTTTAESINTVFANGG